MTNLGLEGIRTVPYGLHACQFYSGRDELAGALIPYFAAGLRVHERCLWITADPVRRDEAQEALAAAGVDCATHIRHGALVIRDFTEWYGDAGTPDGDETVRLWLEEEERALDDGYRGLRIAGNPSVVMEENWQALMDYEAHFHAASRDRHIVTLCTYPSSRTGATQMLDVIERHTCTLERPDDAWQILLHDH